MKSITEKTYRCNIYASGPIAEAESICRQYCKDIGLCITINSTKFIYSYGEEQGYVIGVINYPRFPKSNDKVWDISVSLAKILMDRTQQGSILVESHDQTEWLTVRDDYK